MSHFYKMMIWKLKLTETTQSRKKLGHIVTLKIFTRQQIETWCLIRKTFLRTRVFMCYVIQITADVEHWLWVVITSWQSAWLKNLRKLFLRSKVMFFGILPVRWTLWYVYLRLLTTPKYFTLVLLRNLTFMLLRKSCVNFAKKYSVP